MSEKNEKKPKQKKQNDNKDALKQLEKLKDPKYVLNLPETMSGKELLRLTDAVGDYPYAEKLGLKEYE